MTASASTIPQRPVAEAQSPEQQRLEVELLLQEAVLTGSELSAAGEARWSWHPQLTQESCRDLGCLPVAYANNTLTVAVPTHWGAEQRQTLRSACPEGPPLALRLALQGDLQTVLNQPPPPPHRPRFQLRRRPPTGSPCLRTSNSRAPLRTRPRTASASWMSKPA